MKIYTKSGDKGESAVFGGKKAPKSNRIFEVLGTLDELNSTLGFVHGFSLKEIKSEVFLIQSDLFDMGAFIAGRKFTKVDQISFEAKITKLEEKIDLLESKLTPLKNFILPGGSLLSSYLHNSRSVCRRFERELVKLKSSKKSHALFQIYINRLSDLLFVMARFANKKAKVKDIIWKG